MSYTSYSSYSAYLDNKSCCKTKCKECPTVQQVCQARLVLPLSLCQTIKYII